MKIADQNIKNLKGVTCITDTPQYAIYTEGIH